MALIDKPWADMVLAICCVIAWFYLLGMTITMVIAKIYTIVPIFLIALIIGGIAFESIVADALQKSTER